MGSLTVFEGASLLETNPEASQTKIALNLHSQTYFVLTMMHVPPVTYP